MSDLSSSRFTGAPQFLDSRLALLAEKNGIEAAWHDAVASHGVMAATLATGEFSVGLSGPTCTFLAVDRFAIHPMCYRLDRGQLRFSNRLEALVDEHTEIDPQAIFDYLFFHVIPSPRTIYKGIYRLPPGHSALFEKGQLTVSPYWSPVFAEQTGASLGELKEEFHALLKSAVKSHFNGNTPACFLSGGTDSSSITGMASLASGQRVDTYSIGFEAQGYDEMAYAQLAAKHFSAAHHAYYVTPDDLVHSIPDIARHFDQPFGNSSALPAFYCAKMAADKGATKLLAGDGGDELFGGNTRYAKQRVFGWYDALPSFVKGSLMEPILCNEPLASFPLTRKAASYVEQARQAMPDRLQMYNLLMRTGLKQVLTPQFLAQVDTVAPLQLQRSVWHSPKTCSPLNRELAFDWRFTLAECDLPKVQGAAALAGLSVGFPMLDHRLLDFSQKLPSAYKLKGLKLRWFFKEAMRGFLPDEILTKKKQGFGLPFGVWANSHSPLKKMATNSLEHLATRGLVKPEFIRDLLDHKLAEHPGYFGEMVWILMMLEQWLQGHAPDFSIAK